MFSRKFFLGAVFLVMALVILVREPANLVGNLFITSQPSAEMTAKLDSLAQAREELLAARKIIWVKIDSLNRLVNPDQEIGVYNLARATRDTLAIKECQLSNAIVLNREEIKKITGEK